LLAVAGCGGGQAPVARDAVAAADTVTTADFARIGLSGRIPTRVRSLITQAALACKDKL